MTARARGRATPLDFAAGALAGFARTAARGAIAVVSVPAPAAPTAAFCPDTGLLWRPPGDAAIVGGGEAVSIEVRGAERFAAVCERASALWPGVCHLSAPGVTAPAPRLWGGLAFAPGAADSDPWRAFGDARFVLPAWVAGGAGRGAWLSVACADPADPAARRAALERIELHLSGASGLGPQASGPDTGDAWILEPEARGPRPEALLAVDRETWKRQVDAIRADIAAGRSDKIVLARRTDADLAAEADPRVVASRLAAHHADCTAFAFCRPGAALVGATPERLVARRGDDIATLALAGTAAAGADAALRLSASAKDRREHEFVVAAIAGALAPLCAELSVPAAPSVRRLRGLAHLETAIVGRLARSTHVLALARALHPTPAVGGLPRERAQAWIARAEATPRGWYASPVGWFDARGDGELVVALRCGLLAGRRAHLYAGAGIVSGSDADAEYAETELKQRAVLEALYRGPAAPNPRPDSASLREAAGIARASPRGPREPREGRR